MAGATKTAGEQKEAPPKDAPKDEAPKDGEQSEDAGTGSRKGSMPSYKLQKVGGDLPQQEAGGRARLYFDMLVQVATDPGEWYEVAHFKTPTGAPTALKALKDGEREVPEGEWEFEVRKVANPENPSGPRHSKLYARLVG